jgi:formate--tetrahydrofolate ligase
MTDIEIAKQANIKKIDEIVDNFYEFDKKDIEYHGHYKAKLPLSLIDEEKMEKSNLVLVTAMSPTPAGEGKTTVSIGLAQALNKIGRKTTVVLREPSLGPVFGIKGGATGGGYSQILPMEDINLHFTGDFAAIEKAHNLLSALIDNKLHFNDLNLDPRTIKWKRVFDMNDRSLRKITIGLGGKLNGVPREAGFDITAASEVMAILCMAKDLSDLKERLANIFVGYTYDKKPVYARDINAQGAMTALLKDAIKPNLVQTLENTPAIIHGGPFANIAQGTNTIIATKMGMSLSDYVVTEGGFGADLGAEKFLNIKCRELGKTPKAVVIVATIRALKYHGGMDLKALNNEDLVALEKGIVNLQKHIENIQSFGIQPIVAINKFISDTDAEIKFVENYCEKVGVKAIESNVWGEGGAGTIKLAEQVVEVCAKSNTEDFEFTYDCNLPIKEKIKKIATKIYGAADVQFSAKVNREIKAFEELGIGDLAVCMAKTQKSFSDDPKLKGRPENFVVNISDIEVANGAGFIIPIAGAMMRMPGLPATPAANNIDIDADGNITGLF